MLFCFVPLGKLSWTYGSIVLSSWWIILAIILYINRPKIPLKKRKEIKWETWFTLTSERATQRVVSFDICNRPCLDLYYYRHLLLRPVIRRKTSRYLRWRFVLKHLCVRSTKKKKNNLYSDNTPNKIMVRVM